SGPPEAISQTAYTIESKNLWRLLKIARHHPFLLAQVSTIPRTDIRISTTPQFRDFDFLELRVAESCPVPFAMIRLSLASESSKCCSSKDAHFFSFPAASNW